MSVIEDGVVAGNHYDKYNTRNPIARCLMNGFMRQLDAFFTQAACADVHEIGCGEGELVLRLVRKGSRARGSDFSHEIIALANRNAARANLSAEFKVASVYDLSPEEDAAELIICCEVLEHLEDPERALCLFQKLVKRYAIFSVPREPLWRVLNMARGKYLADFGNTPGHIQHWSRMEFVRLIERYFEVLEVRSPFPWTMLLCRSRVAGEHNP